LGACGLAFRVALFIGATYVFYSLVWNYFRSKKDLPTLTPEFQEALKERMIKERMDPFTGVSAHLFKEDK
jgi:ligand-binding SRPBCC domain-containing protein